MLKVLNSKLEIDFVLLSPPALTNSRLPAIPDAGRYAGYAGGKDKRRERRTKERQSKNK